MSPADLLELLRAVAAGRLDEQAALARLRALPYADLGFARVDHHRALRQGAPEVIFGAGKTPEQIACIAASLLDAGANVLCTRAAPEAYAALKERAHDAQHHAEARAITVVRRAPGALGKVGVLCAGTSDVPVAEEAAVSAAFFGAEVTRLYDVGVAGLHRLLAENAALSGFDVAIVVAGMEGALPSVVGGLVAAPVIAVPTSVGYGA
ncbi:MAG: nickel pincer cofactor biosynthesis protein LarB, partial [Deltaproteobacteria bacterium]|nr:nickel pincer cofactor biosynthesis protein LarB [Deltaproteobacteria bacterium]